jgi:hypothetical protein
VQFERIDPAPEVSQDDRSEGPARPVSVLVTAYLEKGKALHRSLVRSLTTEPSLGTVEVEQPRLRGQHFDYRVTFDFAVEGEGNVGNLFRCFPGFLFVAPQWSPLTWDCRLSTNVLLERTSDRAAVEFTLDEDVVMSYTSQTNSCIAHSGWFGLLFSPLAGIPLGAGLYTTFASAEEVPFFEEFPESDLGSWWAKAVCRQVTARIAEMEKGASPGRRRVAPIQ